MKLSNRINGSGKVAIVIPTNKPTMSEFEYISYKRYLEVLGRYDMFILSPEDLDISEFKKHGSVIHYKQDPKYFGTSLRYNKLMLAPHFYEGLSGYEYILIYQLDCYVFRDDLEHWCDLGFDYIAPPWVGQDLIEWVKRKKRNYPADLKLLHRLTGYKLLEQVGCGGFSLRKTAAMIRNLNLFALRKRYYNGNEDVFVAHYMAALNPFFRIPDVKTALQFGFDANPDMAYEMNGHQIPFGCHEWWRNDIGTYDRNKDFWLEHIPGNVGELIFR